MGDLDRLLPSAPATADAHAPAAAREPSTREPPAVYFEPDPIELACPGCTLIWAGGRWTHDRSCPLRRRRLALTSR